MAARITVEKFVEGRLDESFSVPHLFVDLLVELLPKSGLGELERKGIDLAAIRRAVDSGAGHESTFTVREGGVEKTVVVKVG